MTTVLEQHRKEIQSIVESMSPGSEMLLNDVYKRYVLFKYPPFAVQEEVQRVLQLNLRRFKYYKRDNILQSIISRVEDFV